IAALEAGKHVLLEKPMTLNASLGEEILKARDKSGKLLQMGMVRRQAADSIAVKELIDNGRLGEIYQIRVKLIRRRGIPGLGGWFTTKARSGGGGLIDIAVHFLDLAMWSTGLWNPTKVSAKVYSKFGKDMKNYHYINMWAGPPNYEGTFDVDDYAAGFVRFGKQATLSFEVAWACNAEVESYIEILGDKGGIKIGEKDTVLLTELDGKLADIKLDYDKTRDPFAGEMQVFADAVQGKCKVAATGEEGLVAMKLLDAIYRSSDEDREIEL
ncbi:MAG: Gfo/Idh/MocA family oxidoreductase, partial [Lentisphaeria bacterium]|nr:Gfo/Idh/MocA family oxidoreductase [Lentisphaeria bacterium]